MNHTNESKKIASPHSKEDGLKKNLSWRSAADSLELLAQSFRLTTPN
jgi:hypothetical protein